MQNETPTMQQDTIDLRELFAILKKRKQLIAVVTGLLTLLAIIYAFFIAKPVYSGNVMLEVGQIVNEEFINGEYSSLKFNNLDDINNLKTLVSKTTNVTASIPKKTNLLTLASQGLNKDTIQKNLEDAVTYILDRHKEFAKLYTGKNAKIKMTQVVGEITVGETPIKPKKKLIIIVAFITGLMLSVFLAFFLEFLAGIRREEVSV